MNKAQKTDWKKVVAESNGERMFVPEYLKKDAESIEVMRKDYNDRVLEMSEKEISMKVATQNLFFELRKHLAKNGYPDIWVKDIGFDNDALKDGVIVLNIFEPRQN